MGPWICWQILIASLDCRIPDALAGSVVAPLALSSPPPDPSVMCRWPSDLSTSIGDGNARRSGMAANRAESPRSDGQTGSRKADILSFVEDEKVGCVKGMVAVRWHSLPST